MADGAATIDPAVSNSLRSLDRDRYLAALLVPEARRPAVMALYLFNAELARIREVTSEPLAGEMRLQWWRDAIGGTGTQDGAPGGAAGHPGVRALLEAIASHDLPTDAFERMIEARIADLYNDPFPDCTSFESYAGDTASALIQLTAMVLDGPAAASAAGAAGHAGVAQMAAGALLLLPIHTARGQMLVPLDILSACGLDRETFLTDPSPDETRRVVEAMAAYGQSHLAKARRAAADLPASLRPAFLPVALVEPSLRLAVRAVNNRRQDPRRKSVQAAQWKRQWWLFKAALTGRF